jgi:multicomponent Na+:H+ antiporter subunit D
MPQTVHSLTPLWACLTSLLLVPVLLLLRGKPNLREGASLLAGVVMLGWVVSLLPLVSSGQVVVCTLVDVIPDLPIQFRVDGLGILFALVASSLWIVTTLYALGYMRGLREHSQTRFYAFFAVSLSATLGVAFAGNLLTLYVFYEMLSLATWPLVTHHGDAGSRSGGRTYLTYLLGSSIGLALPALIFCYIRSGGNMDFSPAGFLAGKVTALEGSVVLLMFAYGFAKAGLMPLHSWLPAAMVAPTPVSALLHAVAVVKVGVFCILRVVTGVFGVGMIRDMSLGTALAWVAATTILVSSMIALTQDNLKRRLAFSTIGQLAYIVLGAALVTKLSLAGSMLHIAAHGLAKITLFFCAGAIYVATGKKYVSQLAGIGRTMPVTMVAFFIGSLGVIGLPPSLGLISKFHLLMGTADTGEKILLAVFLISTMLNAAYFLPVVWQAFFPKSGTVEGGEKEFSWSEVREAPWPCVAALSCTALLSSGLFFASGPLQGLVKGFVNSLGW